VGGRTTYGGRMSQKGKIEGEAVMVGKLRNEQRAMTVVRM
jgi:hypothetical protein